MVKGIRKIGNGIWQRRRKIILIVSGLLIVAIAANIFIFYRIRNPKFCLNCHYMKPYYEQWKTSSHKNITCMKCHEYSSSKMLLSTIKYLADSYNPRPRTEIPNKNCLQSGCHEKRLLPAKVKFKGKIDFDHSKHLNGFKRGKVLRCTSCHSQIVQGGHIEVTSEVCYICHFKGAAKGEAITGCPSCHGNPKGIVEHGGFMVDLDQYLRTGVRCNKCHVDVIKGEGNVPKEKCYSCHVERIERYEDHQFIHANHITNHGIDCLSCHQPIEHKNIKMVKTLEVSCEGCHSKLHSAQKEMYMGAAGKGVENTPSRMFAAQVACDGCHTQVETVKGTHILGDKSFKADKRSCIACHTTGYDEMLDVWENEINKILSELGPRISIATEALKSSGKTGTDLSKGKLFIEDAKYNYKFVSEGRGVHNVEYAVKLLKASNDMLDEAMKIVKRDFIPPERSEILKFSDAYCNIMCHKLIKSRDKFEFQEVDFPHKYHINDVGIECGQCHSLKIHKKTLINKKGCVTCHHEDKNAQCSRCHSFQHQLYYGDIKGFKKRGKFPSLMAKGKVTCAGCHDITKPHSMEIMKGKCIECHSKEYGKMLDEWKAKLNMMFGEIRSLIDKDDLALIFAQREMGKEVIDDRKLFNEALSKYNLISKGKGVHNFEYSENILNEARITLAKIWEKYGVRGKP